MTSVFPGKDFHVHLKTGEEQAITMNDGSPGLALNRYDAPYYFRLAYIEGEHYITDGDVNYRQKLPSYVTQVQAWLSHGEDKTRLAYSFYREKC